MNNTRTAVETHRKTIEGGSLEDKYYEAMKNKNFKLPQRRDSREYPVGNKFVKKKSPVVCHGGLGPLPETSDLRNYSSLQV